ncbi:MAG TPA: protein-disulfide reductase DsbD domain-containing protein [bacterium]|nr:protein-disulfide reductase DsbD domain-containing protein [bacterium]
MRRTCLGLLLLLLPLPLLAQNLSHVKVEMLTEQTSVQSGGSVTLGFHFRMQKGWHLYWQNPGDSGQAPSIIWTLPDGFTAGDILWPAPQRLTLPNLADYGYTNEVVLMVPIQSPPKLKSGRFVRFSAKVRWLVCNEICIPGDMNFNARLVVKNHRPKVSGRHEYYFQMARRALPKPLPEGWNASAFLGKKDFFINVSPAGSLSKTATAAFMPLNPNQIENAATPAFRWTGSSFQIKLKRSDQMTQVPGTLDGVLVVKDKKNTKSYQLSMPLQGNGTSEAEHDP